MKKLYGVCGKTGEPCHCDVLLAIANGYEEERKP